MNREIDEMEEAFGMREERGGDDWEKDQKGL